MNPFDRIPHLGRATLFGRSFAGRQPRHDAVVWALSLGALLFITLGTLAKIFG